MIASAFWNGRSENFNFVFSTRNLLRATAPHIMLWFWLILISFFCFSLFLVKQILLRNSQSGIDRCLLPLTSFFSAFKRTENHCRDVLKVHEVRELAVSMKSAATSEKAILMLQWEPEHCFIKGTDPCWTQNSDDMPMSRYLKTLTWCRIY